MFLSALGIYSHLFIYLVIAAHWLSLRYAKLCLLPRKPAFGGRFLIMLTLPINAFTLRGGGQLDWVVEHPTAQMVLNFSKFFAGNAGLSLLGAFVAMCLVGLFWPAASQAPSSSSVNERWVVKLVGTWLLFPIAATLLISFFKPVFSVRYMAISAPALTLLAGHGMAKLDQVSFRLLSFRLRGLFPASLVVMLSLSIFGIHHYDNSPESRGDDWRQAMVGAEIGLALAGTGLTDTTFGTAVARRTLPTSIVCGPELPVSSRRTK